MQYHAKSFADLNYENSMGNGDKHGKQAWKVSLIGYEGERVPRNIAENKYIKEYRLKLLEFSSLRVISILHAAVKGIALFLSVLVLLASLPSYDLIIIQNPPCLPALVAAVLVSLWNKSRIMLDWHNLGFTMFQERLGDKHVLVRVARLLEHGLASTCATSHICVSNTMKVWLQTHFQVSASVLYDRPPRGRFSAAPLGLADRHALLLRLGLTEEALFGPGQETMASSSNSDISGSLSSPSATSGVDGGGCCTVTLQTVCASSGSFAYRAIVSNPSTASTDADSNPRKTRGYSKGGEKSDDGSSVTQQQQQQQQQGGDRSRDRDRVGLLVSCTSWTPDEDFDILLRALLVLEERARLRHDDQLQSTSSCNSSSTSGGTRCSPVGGLPFTGFSRLAVVITGKGPTKQAFEAQVRALTAQGRLNRFVAVRTAWLAAEDYPLLLRCADLGVCLHTSTSGLDLPMKVLDMFGSGMPVCAYAFPALHELVRHGENGLVFESSERLAEQVCQLLMEPPRSLSPRLRGVPAAAPAADGSMQSTDQAETQAETAEAMDPEKLRRLPELEALRKEAINISCWEDNWNSVMQPILSLLPNVC
jgi:beta-1,4-mannosyltransferase